MLPCVLLGDSSETDPLGCLQPLIAITPKWKQSIQPPTTPCTPPLSLSQSSFLRSSFFFSCFRPHSSQSAHFYRSGKKMCLIGGGVMRFMGQGQSGAAVMLLKKDDLLWLRVLDWSFGVLFIYLCPTAAAATLTFSFLFPLPSALASGAARAPGPRPWLKQWWGLLEWKRRLLLQASFTEW